MQVTETETLLPAAWRALSEETKAVLVEAHHAVCGADAAERFSAALRARRDALHSETSRQAQHARTQRMLVTNLAACAVRALENPASAALFQRADYAALRPNCADAHRRFGELAQSRGLRDPKVQATWEHQAAALMARADRAHTLDHAELAILHTTFVPLFACVISGGRALADAWQVLWREASSRGVLDNPGLRVHLAGLGSFAGEAAPAYEVQLDPKLRAIDFATILCLVRRDDTEDLRDRIAAIMRGDEVTPADCLYPARPASTIARAAEYIRGLMRNPYHFNNEGLMLALLSWASEIACFIDIRRDDWSDEIAALLRELARIEQVQVLEKTRFFRVLETLAPGPAREHLWLLWTRSHGAASR